MTRARSRSGLTLFETLVMIAITALIGAVVMNVGARANAGNFDRSTRVAAAQALQVAEEDLRQAAREADAVSGSVDVKGDATAVSIGVVGFAACGLSRNEATFAILANSKGSALIRRCAGRAPVEIARWPAGARPEFGYSTDGLVWRSSFAGDAAPAQGIFVRLRWTGPGVADGAFVVRFAAAVADDGGDEAAATAIAP
jgi:hypothetical protein